MLKTSLQTFYDRQYEVFALYVIYISHLTMSLVLFCVNYFISLLPIRLLPDFTMSNTVVFL
jgi:hypothetical protein